jgi:crossover junction endodeoxyribonuclease RuvC
MKKQTIIGIDPGLNGAIAVFQKAKSFRNKDHQIIPTAVYDMPQMIKLTGNGNQIDPIELRRIIQKTRANIVYLELVTAMHQQGATSAFNFGGSFHVIIGVCIGLGLPIYFIGPKKWRKWSYLASTDKKGALLCARRKWPNMVKSLALAKHQDRADALWIGFVGNKLQDQLKRLVP